MTTNKGYRYRIYPTKQQARLFASFFGCCRFVYNYCLDLRREAYASQKRNVSQYECMREVTQLRSRKETSWLAGCDSMALQETVKDLNRAYTNFFQKRAGYPKYRSKRASVQSYRTRNQNGGVRITDDRHIRLPVVGNVKAKVSRYPKGRILNATITRAASGKYFISLCCEEEVIPKPNGGGVIGIDVGIREFYTDSCGGIVSNPHTLSCMEKKLHREQRKLSRMLEANILKYDNRRRPVWKRPLSECKNIRKQRVRVARVHERIRDIRTDFLHKESSKLTDENQVICIEDLNIKGMVRNHCLAKAVSDASWSRFFDMLSYKAYDHGCDVIRIPTFYPSSQTCSSCGYKNPPVKNLSVREWVCPRCGAWHQRDKNAAVNILNKGLEQLLS